MEFSLSTFVFGVIIGLAAMKLGAIIFSRRGTENDNSSDTTNETSKEKDIYVIASNLEELFGRSAHPKDLLNDKNFEQGVQLLIEEHKTATLISYAEGENPVIACMALRALAGRELQEAELTRIINAFTNMGLWAIYFALEIIQQQSSEPRLGQVLSKVQSWWTGYPISIGIFEHFIKQQIEKGFAEPLGKHFRDCDKDTLAEINKLLKDMQSTEARVIKAKINAWRKRKIDSDLLEGIGRLWDKSILETPIVEYEALINQATRINETLFHQPGRSMIVVGERGVGKTTLLQYIARSAQDAGWHVFEATAGEVIAGQKYIGELEGRIKLLLATLGPKRKVIWYVPDIYEMVAAGSYREKPRGMLDLILPAIERGELIVIGDATPDSYENILQARPKIKTVFETLWLEPVPDHQVLEIAYDWADMQARRFGDAIIDKATINEAFDLVQHYLHNTSTPGNLLQLLKATVNRLASSDSEHLPVSKDDLLISLSQITNIPADILDDRQELNLDHIRGVFRKRLIGQDEAVKCLVERIAMIKAGVTDPTRPFGVFLFAGPTGTGKTEIAKTLAKVLFGSESRLIRIDMSEYQAPDSSWRLLQENDPRNPSKSLVTQVRQQPFSVVLLDEFEKAHPNVWDIFLQVFDDGRLTDRLGHTVSFRQSIIILTSNLGATISTGSSIGFLRDTTSFSPSVVEKAVNQTFRREFINRLDRVVIFNPLTRSVMREILHKDLQMVFNRQGLRYRDWAVEFDDSILEFLLDKGFTMDMGARPLKRAIERYVLSPLAETIVERRFPMGDQFLFLSRNGDQIHAQFVDPDNPEPDTAVAVQQISHAEKLDLRNIALEAKGTVYEFQYLETRLADFVARMDEDSWLQTKNDAIAKMSTASFWEEKDRFTTLALIEFMDRIESGCKSAESIMQRLKRKCPSKSLRYHPNLVRRLAEQLYLLETALQDFSESTPSDAFILLETKFEMGKDPQQTSRVYSLLLQMYQNWGKCRRMNMQVIANDCDDAGQCRGILAVSGFGAYRILQPESGLHVFELPENNNQFERVTAMISVVAQPFETTEYKHDIAAQVEALFNDNKVNAPTVVRRYREGPSPLVKDSVRNWRTGRLDRVLAGDFDLI